MTREIGLLPWHSDRVVNSIQYRRVEVKLLRGVLSHKSDYGLCVRAHSPKTLAVCLSETPGPAKATFLENRLFVQLLQICVRVRFEIFCGELTLTRAIGDRLTAYSRIYFPETITGDTLIIGEC